MINYNHFIEEFTQGKCHSFEEFQRVAKQFGLFFEKINGEMILGYEGRGEVDQVCYEFYRYFFPETKLQVKNFNLIAKIHEVHFQFVLEEVNEVYQKYNLPPRYDRTLSIRENAVLLLNTLKIKTAIRKEDLEFIQYILKY
ncbi:hypothetical protein EGX98_12170 [Fusobacterium necrophorum]|uniref:hypothetical protein n=1 Tax=Fusobacterium necrophorum TaxID=859 RepID=UPI0004614FB8|nr:hypothetical protein [Fusobacterium necrophorum]AYZ74700.1 hypothetical protein EGX98_12170 [Fusobacterium necrophorum]AZW09414.1 hypothetical protein EO219_07415 [Fusobacterium necrophorum subsp. necrophorum]KDE73809.1 hypothetical protein FUSO7_06155 [Fusobacterium necrophorum BFTR-2]MBR8733246.1 hypothetical protein [Fusobacterium necrophorum]MBR8789423.1 hypothetical protein [Fusobacterium necrophorum]